MPRSENPPGRIGLTSKQEAFALACCRLMNASDAYKAIYKPQKATPKTINEAASRLVKNGKVAARISEIRAAAEDAGMLTIERVRTELARLCFFDARKVFDEDGNPKQVHEIDDDTAAAIEHFEIKESVVDGRVVGRTTRVRFCDKNASLGMAARHLGLFEKDHAQRDNAPMRVVIELVGEATSPRIEQLAPRSGSRLSGSVRETLQLVG